MKQCSLVSSAATMFETVAGAWVEHAPGCDGKCDVQRRLDARVRLRELTMQQMSADDEE